MEDDDQWTRPQQLTTEAKPPGAAATEDVSPPAGRILRRPAANEMDSGIVSASEARLARPSKPAVSPAALRRIEASTTSPITGCSASAPWRASEATADLGFDASCRAGSAAVGAAAAAGSEAGSAAAWTARNDGGFGGGLSEDVAQ